MGLAAVCFVADLVWDEPLVLLRCVPLLLFACLLGLLIGFYVFMVAHLVVQAGDWIEESGRVVDHRSAIVDTPPTRCTSRPADGT
jgi:hypothetical protein